MIIIKSFIKKFELGLLGSTSPERAQNIFVCNPYQYNDKEMLDEDMSLNWSGYGYRSYDPQIGRFVQLDPLTDLYSTLTPYQYASNDPITNIDVDGLEGCPEVAGMVGYFSKIGSVSSLSTTIFDGISVLSTVSAATNITISAISITSTVVNTNTRHSLIQQQTSGNTINGQNNIKPAGK